MAATLAVTLTLLALTTALFLARVPLIKALIRWKLGPYRFTLNHVDETKPRALDAPKQIAVIGAGLAGLSTASTLAARGYAVTLFESNPYLGGKIAAWTHEPAPGISLPTCHGYHAFFRHYYNLNRWLDALGVRQRFAAIDDYRILLPDGSQVAFDSRETTPVLNLLSMAKQGLYRLGDVMRAPTRDALGVFLEYDPERTVAQLDHLSLAELDRRAKLPPRLKMAFNTFARAFFATEDRLSMAALVKGFHSYYLGHDGGLVYDHPTDDYRDAVLAPMRAQLDSLKVKVELEAPVDQLTRHPQGFTVRGETFEQVVLATDVVGTRKILENGKGLDGLDPRLLSLEPGQRYSVLRLWLDRPCGEGLPVFVITERFDLLDAIAFSHRLEKSSARWAQEQRGSVVELHCYAVPDEVPEADLEARLTAELKHFLPALENAAVLHRHFQVRRDFPAFHVGKAHARPGTDSGVPGLYCAGDWVQLDFPAMLMEAACSSGLVAANRIFASHGLQEEPVETVPLRGLLAGLPQSPARKRLIAASG
ncbi:MAG: FAD-dependent oxidoreductase [Archangiaceae bacterium]|nr:FAD-dependent oxidoreductase [Archangiaceae bacterium]